MSEVKKMRTTDKTTIYYLDGKIHNWDGPALIPKGNKRLAEYYLFGINTQKSNGKRRKKMLMDSHSTKHQLVKLQVLEFKQSKDYIFIIWTKEEADLQ
jgi:hypothetical protein